MKASILFLSSGNTTRSILAEAIANQQFASDLQAWSAGIAPGAELPAMTVETIREQGLDPEGLRPKGCVELQAQHFDLVITLCEEARDATLPELTGQPRHIHWPLPDPTAADQPHDVYEAIYDTLVEAVGLLVYAPHPELNGRATEAGRQICRRFAPRAA
ncbi:MAG: arsenate-mycothiol transferase ArsC [Planctomycetota bacterium]|jgi:protein-tyrosine-phosphatase